MSKFGKKSFEKNPSATVSEAPASKGKEIADSDTKQIPAIKSSLLDRVKNMFTDKDELEKQRASNLERILALHSEKDSRLAEDLLRNGLGIYIVEHCTEFKKLNAKVALVLVNSFFGVFVSTNLHLFNLDQRELKEIADALIMSGQGSDLFKNERLMLVYGLMNYLIMMIKSDHKMNMGLVKEYVRAHSDTCMKLAQSAAQSGRIEERLFTFLTDESNYSKKFELKKVTELLYENLKFVTACSEKQVLELFSEEHPDLLSKISGFDWISELILLKEKHGIYFKELKLEKDKLLGFNKDFFDRSNYELATVRRLQNDFNYQEYLKILESRCGEQVTAKARQSRSKFEWALLEKSFELNQLEDLVKNIFLFKEIDSRTILEYLVINNCGQFAIDKWSVFLKLEEIFYVILSKNRAELIWKNFDLFKEFLSPQAIPKLIEHGLVDFYLENRELIEQKTSEYSDNEIANIIFDKNAFILAKRLAKFEDGLDAEIAYKLAQKGYGKEVLGNLEVFIGADLNKIREILSETGTASAVASRVDQIEANSEYQDNGQKLAEYLIENGQTAALAKNLKSFTGLSNGIFSHLLDAGFSFQISHSLDSFQQLGNDAATELVKNGRAAQVDAQRDQFKNVNWKSLFEDALKLVEWENGDFVTENINDYPELDRRKLLQKLLTTRQGLQVAHNPSVFEKIYSQQQIVTLLIDHGYKSALAANLDQYSGLDRKVFQVLFPVNATNCLKNLNSFANLSEEEAEMLLNGGFYSYLWNRRIKFQITEMDFVQLLIKKGKAEYLIRNLGKSEFSELNDNLIEIADLLIKNENFELLAANLEKFSGLPERVFLSLFNKKKQRELAGNLASFCELSSELARDLITLKFELQVGQNLEVFVDYNKSKFEDDLRIAKSKEFILSPIDKPEIDKIKK